MKKNIQALKVINTNDASLFLQEALRYYSKELIKSDSPVVLVEVMRGSFDDIATAYLQWEDSALNKVLERMETEDMEAYQLRMEQTDPSDEINWDALEDAAFSDDH